MSDNARNFLKLLIYPTGINKYGFHINPGREGTIPVDWLVKNQKYKNAIDELMKLNILKVIDAGKHIPDKRLHIVGVKYPITYEEIMSYRYSGKDISYEEYSKNPDTWEETIEKMKKHPNMKF